MEGNELSRCEVMCNVDCKTVVPGCNDDAHRDVAEENGSPCTCEG